MVPAQRVGPIARIVGAIGAWLIYRLIGLFGRTHRWADVPWLAGPLGEATIGDAPYRDVAAKEGLSVERDARDGGLVPDFGALGGGECDPAGLSPLVREFKGAVRDHTIRFLGMPVVKLHYKMIRTAA